MIISHKHKFIFFSNPKTGSESVRLLLRPYSNVRIVTFPTRTIHNPFYSHITPKETREIFVSRKWDFGSYQRFVFTRNPWKRIVSIFLMIKRLDQSNQTTFKEWLQTIDNQGIGGGGFDSARWRKYGTYSIDNYVGDGSGKFLVDKIFRLEDINDCLLPFLKKLNLENLPQSIPFINKGSNNENIEEWYDSSSCKIIEKLFHYEIEHFNYRFKK